MQNGSRILAGLVALSLVTVGCTKKDADAAATSTTPATPAATPAAAPADHTADALAIMRLDSAWEKGLEAKKLDMILPYYMPDAVSYGYGYGSAPATGSDQIKAEYTEMVKTTFTNAKTLNATVKFSDDGLMAYDHGIYQMTAQSPG